MSARLQAVAGDIRRGLTIASKRAMKNSAEAPASVIRRTSRVASPAVKIAAAAAAKVEVEHRRPANTAHAAAAAAAAAKQYGYAAAAARACAQAHLSRGVHSEETVIREDQPAEHTMFITGATGEFAPGLMVLAMQKNIRIIACSRRERDSIDPKRLQWLQTKEEDITDPEMWLDALATHAGKSQRVSVVNLIGAAVPPKGKSLEDVNVKPVLAVHRALQDFADAYTEIDASMVHVSSICASVLGDDHDYSSMRKFVDESLTVDTDRVNAVVFRPGLVFNDLCEGNMVNMGHPYSPEQFATLPFHPVIGSGEQIQQPVHQGDLGEAIINATYATEDAIIDAVGPESMTQAEMFEFFVKLKGGTFRKIRIPYAFGHVMAKHFPMGRIAPYSIAAFEKLDDPEDQPFPVEPFQRYVGHELKSMSDVYLKVDGQEGPIILARPPVMRHIRQIAKKLILDQHARSDVIDAVRRDGLTIGSEISRVMLSDEQ